VRELVLSCLVLSCLVLFDQRLTTREVELGTTQNRHRWEGGGIEIGWAEMGRKGMEGY
jgi:hypothetical protein